MSDDAHAARGALLLAMRGAGVRDLAVLRAIEAVPREDFLPHRLRDLGNRNIAVPIACGQAMFSPLSLALMLDALAVRATDRVLEIGTGTGYATAVLVRLAGEVVTFERYRTLATEAQVRFTQRDLAVKVLIGDGLMPPSNFGSFDRAIVHAAIAQVPPALAGAMRTNARIVSGIPADAANAASLALWERTEDGAFAARRLVPMRLPAVQSGVARAL